MGVRFVTRVGSSSNRMAMRRERLLFLGGGTLMFSAIVIAGLLVVQSQAVQAKSKEVEIEPLNQEVALGTVVLLAPTSRITKGTKITPQFIREVHWPRDQVPEGAIRKMEDLDSMFASANLVENQPILRSSVAANPPSLGISDLLTPGSRAVTINVNSVSGIEGWAKPGAHVDVLLTYLDSKDGKNKTIVAVENAVVLSYGGSAESNHDADSDRVAGPESTTATLAVPVADSLKIQTAMAMGRITLVLRSQNDIATPSITEFTQDEWDQSHRPVAQEKRQAMVRGIARIPGKDGVDRQFVLGDDNRWQHDAVDEETY